MRFIPQIMGSGGRRFNNGARPPLDLLPKPLVDKILERDRIMAQRSLAKTRVNDLAGDQPATVARRADDEAATKAARSGKPIPAPTAVPKLEQARIDAAHALAAQEAVFAVVETECDDVASRLFFDGEADNDTARIKVQADLEAQAHKLADAVQAAVVAVAVLDWMRTGNYNHRAATWPSDVIPELANLGIDRRNSTPVDVRSIITRAATTCLDNKEI